MTRNPSDTQRTKYQFQKENPVLCHANSPPLERCNKLPVRCYMERSDQLHRSQKNEVDHTPLHPKEEKVTFLLPSIIILGGDGKVYMLGPRIPVHRTSCTLLLYIIEMKVAATYFQFFKT